LSEVDNKLKYGNYTEQMGRLKKAMANHFLLEALFIEYAVIEDRTESILRHAGVFNPEKHNTLAGKLSRIADIARGKQSLSYLKVPCQRGGLLNQSRSVAAAARLIHTSFVSLPASSANSLLSDCRDRLTTRSRRVSGMVFTFIQIGIIHCNA